MARDRCTRPVARLREARSFDEWWEAVCAAAGQLEFASVALSVEASEVGEHGDGSDGGKGADSVQGSEGGDSVESGFETLIWHNPALTPAPEQVIHMTISTRHLAAGLHGRLELAVWVNGSLESATRRATLFSRLLEE